MLTEGEKSMKVVIFGATGMVGQGVLRESLLAKDVEQVLAVVRTPTGLTHPKLREVTLADFADLSPIRDQLAGYDACFYCLGVSSVGMDEAAYARISYDFPMAAAREPLPSSTPRSAFIYVSGAGTNPDGRQMWARVKGRTEHDRHRDCCPNGYAVRPGIIQPDPWRAVEDPLVQRRLHASLRRCAPAGADRPEIRHQHRPARPGHAAGRAGRLSPARPGERGPALSAGPTPPRRTRAPCRPPAPE